MNAAPIRVLVAKPGLDGHDRGARVIVRALRDAGMEVIYTGLHQTPEMILTAAQQEDPDVICVSILSGAHMTLLPRLCELLKQSRMDTPVMAGGIIPEDDAQKLRSAGVREVMGPGTTTQDIIEMVKWLAMERRSEGVTPADRST
ncbi:MAG: cobalamin B12-binding domain-containing protein [bacterium]|nr:cobalamin B12-binding domain-containing protein [bacterium]